jgi:hypothetical protein
MVVNKQTIVILKRQWLCAPSSPILCAARVVTTVINEQIIVIIRARIALVIVCLVALVVYVQLVQQLDIACFRSSSPLSASGCQANPSCKVQKCAERFVKKSLHMLTLIGYWPREA